jgi:hypothetical protein
VVKLCYDIVDPDGHGHSPERNVDAPDAANRVPGGRGRILCSPTRSGFLTGRNRGGVNLSA